MEILPRNTRIPSHTENNICVKRLVFENDLLPCTTDTDDSQSRPTWNSCQVDFKSVSPTPMTQNDTICHPCDNEQKSQSQQDSAGTNITVDEVDGEEPSHDTNSFRHKNVLGAQSGCNGQEPLPPGQGGGYLKDDIVNRNESSVWDSFDGSTVHESRNSLHGESFRPCVVLGMI